MSRSAPLWQEHPEHGKMPVYDRKHAEVNRRNGWKDVQPEQPKKASKKADTSSLME